MGVTGARDARENSSTASGSTDSAGRHSCGALGLSAEARRPGPSVPTDGRARQPGDREDSLRTALSRRSDPAGREYPSPALIELRANRLPSLPNRLRVDHVDPHTAAMPSQESRCPESNHHMTPRCNPIHLLRRMCLVGHKNRQFHAVEQIAGDPAQQFFPKSWMAERAGDQKVGADIAGFDL
jgi:hypothetical protein